MKLTVAGCSPAWPNPGGAQSGYLVENGGGRLLLDCGPGVLPRLRAAEGWPRVDSIVISHFHLDHWGDVVPWVWGLKFGPAIGEPHPELWLPPGGGETLARFGVELGQPSMFDETFEIHEYEDQKPFEAAGQRVVPHRVLHYEMLAFGFRVSSNGSTLAYSADSGPTDALVSLARDADLFLCEATLLQPEPRGRDSRAPVGRRGGRGLSGVGCRPAPADPPPGRASTRGRLRAGVRRARARALAF